MKNLRLVFSSLSKLSLDKTWVEFTLGSVLVVAFVTLGYFSREFALDVQANFFKMF